MDSSKTFFFSYRAHVAQTADIVYEIEICFIIGYVLAKFCTLPYPAVCTSIKKRGKFGSSVDFVKFRVYEVYTFLVVRGLSL